MKRTIPSTKTLPLSVGETLTLWSASGVTLAIERQSTQSFVVRYTTREVSLYRALCRCTELMPDCQDAQDMLAERRPSTEGG